MLRECLCEGDRDELSNFTRTIWKHPPISTSRTCSSCSSSQDPRSSREDRAEQSEPCPTDSDCGFCKAVLCHSAKVAKVAKAEKMCSVEGSNPPVGTVRVDDFKHHWLYLLTDLTAVFCIVLCSFRSFQIIHKQNSQNWEVFLGRISAVGVAPKKHPPGDPGDPHGFGHDAETGGPVEQPASVDPGDFLSWFPTGLATIWEIQPEDSYFFNAVSRSK